MEKGPSKSLKIVLGVLGSSGLPPTWGKEPSPLANLATKIYTKCGVNV